MIKQDFVILFGMKLISWDKTYRKSINDMMI